MKSHPKRTTGSPNAVVENDSSEHLGYPNIGDFLETHTTAL
ncbi:MAG: hypothetical protein ACXADY_13450 [Candidatus Hodarchaeales archaeon]